ncbi:NLR family, CARD domain containing 3 [Seminavis robusta]|uniref:NLR family, CARD domain containing 3 n=1 Tax=Seminavis robusta TaxID=568900 RepID=A0A9N8DUK9_9STRA|nr:NLR family, CARD domain containing 3 [Seminavis robusta]|eukprot:Sro354_g124740.1 NLR family, CARD domain containing 3 (395) ;mRNA; f:25434-26618
MKSHDEMMSTDDEDNASRNLRHLRVGPKILNSLQQETSLQHLWLGPTFSSSVTLDKIAEILSQSQLRSLDLDLSLMAASSTTTSCNGSRRSNKATLETNDWTCAMECFVAQLSSVEKLCLRLPTRQEGVVLACIQGLATGLTCSNAGVKTLDLRSNRMDDQAAMVLAAALPQMTSVRHLILTWNRIGSVGAEALAKALNHSRLERLDLSHNPALDDTAAVALSRALQTNTRLQVLNLSGCTGITVQGGLAKLVECLGSTKHNNINHNNVTLEHIYWKNQRPTRHDPRMAAAAESTATATRTNQNTDDKDILQAMEYYLSLNRAGRRLLIHSKIGQEKVSIAVWPHVLAKTASVNKSSLIGRPATGPHELFYLLRQNPGLFEHTQQQKTLFIVND